MRTTRPPEFGIRPRTPGSDINKWFAILILLQLLAGSFALAGPDPEKGSIGIRLHAPRSKTERVASFGMGAAIKIRANSVYFVRLDDSLSSYTIEDRIWPYYSWKETEDLLRNATGEFSSFRYNKGNTYLIDVEPGRYVAVGAKMHDNAGTMSGRMRQPYLVAFSDQLTAQTEVILQPGEIVFLGDFTAILGGAIAGSQQEFFNRNPVQGYKKAVAELHTVERDDGSQNKFWGYADKVFENEPHRLSLERRVAAAPSIESGASLLTQDALELFLKEKHKEALGSAKNAVRVAESDFGPENPRVAAFLSNLAQLHSFKNSHDLAKPLYEKALEIREKSLGPDHPAVAFSLLELANSYLAIGGFPAMESGKINPEAEQAAGLARRAVEIREKALGPEHPDVGFALDHLAICYLEAGVPDRAVPLLERAQTILVQKFGEHGRGPALIANNLKSAKQMQGASNAVEGTGEGAVVEPSARASLGTTISSPLAAVRDCDREGCHQVHVTHKVLNAFNEAFLENDADSLSALMAEGVSPGLESLQTDQPPEVISPAIPATQLNHLEVMEAFLKHGGNPDTRYSDGSTLLILSSYGGHTDLARLLLEHNADVNAVDNPGASPLFYAAQEERTDIVKLLLESGADVNTKCYRGQTALIIAARNRQAFSVTALLAHPEINVNLQDDKGKTALDVAKGSRVKKLLKEAGAKKGVEL